MKWSTYFVTVIPRDQSDGRLQGKDELEQVSISAFLCLPRRGLSREPDRLESPSGQLKFQRNRHKLLYTPLLGNSS